MHLMPVPLCSIPSLCSFQQFQHGEGVLIWYRVGMGMVKSAADWHMHVYVLPVLVLLVLLCTSVSHAVGWEYRSLRL